MTEFSNEKTDTESNRETNDRIDLVDHVEVDCEATLGTGTITIGRLSSIAKGEVIQLDRSPADPIDLKVNGKVIARGEIVTVEGQFAIRLTQIG